MRINQLGETIVKSKLYDGTTWVELLSIKAGQQRLAMSVGGILDIGPYDDYSFSWATLATGNVGTTVGIKIMRGPAATRRFIVEKIWAHAPSADAIYIYEGAIIEGADVQIGPGAGVSRRGGCTITPEATMHRIPNSALGPMHELFRVQNRLATGEEIVYDVPHMIDVDNEGIAVLASQAGVAQDLAVVFIWREEPA